MPCKPAKAEKLLETGKAVKKQRNDGISYLQLKFNPSSPIAHPPTESIQNSGSNVLSKRKSRDRKLNNMFDSSYLAKVRKKAQRKNVWFRSLCKGDRDILNLTIRCVDQPKSPRLVDILAKIIVKIKKALMSPIFRLIEEIGRPLAKKLSQIAKSWGNETAGKWVEDKSFMRYLAIVFGDYYRRNAFNMSTAIEN